MIGSEVAVFQDATDLRNRIQYYLKHPQEREAIARAGQTRVCRDHNIEKRVSQMLSIINAKNG